MSNRTRKSDGGGLVGGTQHRDRVLIAARALSNKDWENPATIKLARHMAHDGATLKEIADALDWNERTARYRLAKYNIHPYSKLAHRGEDTTLPHYQGGFEIYRPRKTGAAE